MKNLSSHNSTAINSTLIDYYFENFFGYGSWDGEFLFVGVEEGTGCFNEDLWKIFKVKCPAFCHQGPNDSLVKNKNILLNFKDFNEGIYDIYFKNIDSKPGTPYLHYTLKHIIKLLLYFSQKNTVVPSPEEMLDFQINYFGNSECDFPSHAAIEILPAPLKNSDEKTYLNFYNEFLKKSNQKELVALEKRDRYIEYCLKGKPSRLNFLKDKITNKENGVVVFYAKSLFEYILLITETESRMWEPKTYGDQPDIENSYSHHKSKSKTLYMLVDHPSHNSSETYWKDIADAIITLRQ